MSHFQLMLIILLSSIIRNNSANCRIYENVLNFTVYRPSMIYYNETNSVYLFGGRSVRGAYLTDVQKWNLNEPNSQFEPIGKIPMSINAFQSPGDNSVLINDTVYFLGVLDNKPVTGPVINDMYKYHIPSESWLNTSNLSKPSFSAFYGCLTTNDSHLFWFDGYRENRNNILFWIYDIVRDEWKSYELDNINGGTANEGWYGQYCYVDGNDLYVFGGTIDSKSVQSMYRWDFETESLINIGSLPPKQYKGATVYHEGVIHLVGNEGSNKEIISFVVDGECIYDNNLTLVIPVHSAGSVVINDTLYVFGGYDNNMGTYGSEISTVQICDLSDDAIASCPTVAPTVNPTLAPTLQPSQPPTSSTIYPTSDPTIEPTTDPTTDPSKYPTIKPSSSPINNNQTALPIYITISIDFAILNSSIIKIVIVDVIDTIIADNNLTDCTVSSTSNNTIINDNDESITSTIYACDEYTQQILISYFNQTLTAELIDVLEEDYQLEVNEQDIVLDVDTVYPAARVGTNAPTQTTEAQSLNIDESINVTIILICVVIGVFGVIVLVAITAHIVYTKKSISSKRDIGGLHKMSTLDKVNANISNQSSEPPLASDDDEANPNKVFSNKVVSSASIENIPEQSSQPPLSFINDSDEEQVIVDEIEIEGKPQRAKPLRVYSASSDHGDDDYSKDIVLDEGEFVVNDNSYKDGVGILTPKDNENVFVVEDNWADPELDEEVIGNEQNTLRFDEEDGIVQDDEFVIEDEEEEQRKTTKGGFDENELGDKNKDESNEQDLSLRDDGGDIENEEDEEKMETNGNRQEMDFAVNIGENEIVTKGHNDSNGLIVESERDIVILTKGDV